MSSTREPSTLRIGTSWVAKHGWARVLLWAALFVGAVSRLYVAFTDYGMYWPDEVHQSLEPAHRLVFGYGLVAWEFVEGARNWAFPGFVAGLMRISASVGGDDPRVYLHVIRVAFVAMSLGVGFGVFRLARVSGASEPAAAAAAAVWALSAPAIYFAHRAMSENAAALVAVWGVALLLTPGISRRTVWLGAFLLGLSVLFRLQMGLLAVGVVGVLAARRDSSSLLHALAALFLCALAYGALDAATWNDAPDARLGGWFHSAAVYWQFNVVEDGASNFGVSSATYYPRHLFTSMPFAAVCIAAGLLAGLRFASSLTIITLLFAGAHAAVPHKEFRFILPALPLALAAAAAGLDKLPARPRTASLACLALSAVISLSSLQSLTWGEIGAFPDNPNGSAWDNNGSVNRLLLAAHGARPRVCGIRVTIPPVWTGGSSFLHRPARIYADEHSDLGLYNYAIIGAGSGRPVVARDGDWELVRLPDVRPCIRQPHYNWQLQ